MAISAVFINNRTQAVRLPAETRFPDTVKKVQVRVAGQERIISPAESAWDSFFLGAITATDDFIAQRARQSHRARGYLGAVMLKYLLDTNIVIYVIKQRPIQVLEVFNRHQGRMAVSAITLAELIHGAEKVAMCLVT